jgi:aryl-alcohol dehydrogenase-like predicted oxidoreductase
MQNHYNLAYREEEREMLPLLREMGVACIPWSPLARGFLTEDPDSTREPGPRRDADKLRQQYYAGEADRAVAAEVGAIAKERGVSRAQIACAWLLSPHSAGGGVAAPIVGPQSVAEVEDLVAATALQLTLEEVKRLERPYRPKPVLGHI